MSIKTDFGKRIKEIRIKKGVTQYQLAESAGIDPKHMSHIETGRSFPKADLIEKFAKSLDVEYTEFFKTQHLQDRKTLIIDIKEAVNKLSDNDLRNIYKIISGYIN